MKVYFPKKFTMIITTTVLFCNACGGSDNKEDETAPDTEKPKILTAIPIQKQQILTGGTLLYTGTFTDNEALKQVVFSIKSNKASSKAATGVENEPWNTNPSEVKIELSGKTQTITEKVLFDDPIPNNIWTDSSVDGTYTLVIECTDSAGNEIEEEVVLNIQGGS